MLKFKASFLTAPALRLNGGYMLIEILVTVGILAVGLLGVSAMQITSLKKGYNSIQLGESSILIGSMTARMRANTAAVVAGNYDINTTLSQAIAIAANANENTKATDSGTRAARDIDAWVSEIAAVFGTGTAPQARIDCGSTALSNNCILEINWSDSRVKSSLELPSSTSTETHIVSVAF